ncbi:uncharacterized protein [Paramormyrops kingsleyae]|uniref:uncharacterized protein n=1 Tax=Paramormyrops kingsleyae TaxID=1676925 RepID=UPI003B97B428
MPHLTSFYRATPISPLQSSSGPRSAKPPLMPLNRHSLLLLILAYANFQLPFKLYTDASLNGLGAVLSQVQDGKERVIAYASRSLHRSERGNPNVSSFKLELLALKWAITEKFKDYLWGAQVIVFTDNNPLVHLETAKLGATEQRWVAQLANYSYEIHYRPGARNQNADALSRLPGDPADVVMYGVESTMLPEALAEPGGWGRQQKEDPDLRQMHIWKAQGEPPRILSDQGGAFESDLMQKLCAVYGCKKDRTTPYHPQGNGICERFNRTLLSLLSTMEVASQAQWPSALPVLLQAYNNTTHASTGMTPHYVLFGRHARLPVDVLHGVAPPQYRGDLEGWVKNHHQTLLEAYTKVWTNVERR